MGDNDDVDSDDGNGLTGDDDDNDDGDSAMNEDVNYI